MNWQIIKFDKVMTVIFFVLVACFIATFFLLLRFANINERNIQLQAESLERTNKSIVVIDSKIDSILAHLSIEYAKSAEVKQDVDELMNNK